MIISWSRTIYQQFELLAGKSAPHDFVQLLIYKAATFSEEIDKIDTVRAYHVCIKYFLRFFLLTGKLLERTCMFKLSEAGFLII